MYLINLIDRADLGEICALDVVSGSSLFGPRMSSTARSTANTLALRESSCHRHSFVRPGAFLRAGLAQSQCCRAQVTSRMAPWTCFDAARRALLLFGMGTEALPVWDKEDEVEPSGGRPYRYSYGRHKNRSDLTSSFVPRGTPSARGGGNQSLRLSVYSSLAVPSGRCSFLFRPAELRAVNPDAVHDHGKPARQRHDCPLQSAVPGDGHGPGFEP